MDHSTQADAGDVQSLDTIYGLLSDHRRRRVVSHLSSRQSPIALHDLATALAAGGAEGRPTEEIDQLALTLHHAQLPHLDDADIIDYDTETNTITPTRVHALTPFLDAPDVGE